MHTTAMQQIQTLKLYVYPYSKKFLSQIYVGVSPGISNIYRWILGLLSNKFVGSRPSNINGLMYKCTLTVKWIF